MPEILDVGIYNASAPHMPVSAYDNLEKLIDVTEGLVTQPGGGVVDLSGHRTAEAWYTLQGQVEAATKRLGEVNDSVAKEIKVLADNLKGVAGDAFNGFLREVLTKSQELYNTLHAKNFALQVGDIGHCIQWFGDEWWKAITNSEANRKDGEVKVLALAAAEAELVQTDADVQTVINNLQTRMDALDDSVEQALIKALQDLLAEMVRQYTAYGQNLAPLYIAGGERTTTGGNDNNNDNNNDDDDSGTNNDDDDEEDEQPRHYEAAKLAEAAMGDPGQELMPAKMGSPMVPGLDGTGGGTGGGSGGGLGGLGGAANKAAQDAIDGIKAQTTDPEALKALDDAKKAVGEALGGGGLGGGSSPGNAIDAAKDAAQKAIDGVKAGTTDPEAQKALEDAKKAVGDALNGVGGGGVPGMGGSPKSKALDDAKKAAMDAIDKIAGGTDDPEADKALEDAKKAVGDAIDGLDSEANGALDEAKDAAKDAIDDIKSKTDDPEAQKALDEAKKAVDKAIDGISPDGGGAESALKAAGEAANKALDDAIAKTTDPEARKALEDAKNAVDKAIGDIDPEKAGLLGEAKDRALDAIDGIDDKTNDPEADKALDEAKKAVGDAIDAIEAGGDGPPGEVLKDAGEAATKALDDAIAKTTDPEAKQALQDAKKAVGDAISAITPPSERNGLPSTVSGGPGSLDPDTRAALGEARSVVDKAFDDLLSKEKDPEAKNALREAKDAVGKAIDGIKSPGADMKDFLGGGGSGGGSGGGGVGGLGGSGTDPLPRAQFDTDVAQQRGLAPGGVQTVSGTPQSLGVAATNGPGGMGGMPMGMGGMPMGMGGMGGMGGGQQGSEREPQIWLQADKDAWGEEPDSQDDGVLGRTTQT